MTDALISGSFEAKKHGIRQTKDGWVVSFVIHPKEMTPEFAACDFGTHFVLGYQEYDPDAKEPPKEKRRPVNWWPSQIAYNLCQDTAFQEWLGIQPLPNPEAANIELKRRLRIKSKSELDTDAGARARWDALLTDFDFRNTPALER